MWVIFWINFNSLLARMSSEPSWQTMWGSIPQSLVEWQLWSSGGVALWFFACGWRFTRTQCVNLIGHLFGRLKWTQCVNYKGNRCCCCYMHLSVCRCMIIAVWSCVVLNCWYRFKLVFLRILIMKWKEITLSNDMMKFNSL